MRSVSRHADAGRKWAVIGSLWPHLEAVRLALCSHPRCKGICTVNWNLCTTEQWRRLWLLIKPESESGGETPLITDYLFCATRAPKDALLHRTVWKMKAVQLGNEWWTEGNCEWRCVKLICAADLLLTNQEMYLVTESPTHCNTRTNWHEVFIQRQETLLV